MKGDFTRWTFDPRNHFTRVLLQQGRVQLDADWNEQAAILLHYLRSLAEDLIGPFGAPANPDGTAGSGFRPVATVQNGKPAFRLLPGRYYVGGYLVENPDEPDLVYSENIPPWPPVLDANLLLYLDVWEKLVTSIQDDHIREVALGGVDTAVRAQVTWRVRAQKVAAKACLGRADWNTLVGGLQPVNRGRLKAQARRKDGRDNDSPCLAAPDAGFSGNENQLYRVEIHQGGAAGAATFKWSRENGSVTFLLERLAASADAKTFVLTLESLGRDGRFGLAAGNWVEALDDSSEPGGALLRADSVDADHLQVTFQGSLPALDLEKHPYLRRWDQKGRGGSAPQGDLLVQESQWLELESGIQIWFEPAPAGTANAYRAGDYWLIPARTATGEVEWQKETTTEGPKALPPLGVEHRYAPLGLASVDPATGKVVVTDCRTTFGERALVLDTGVADWQVIVPPGAAGPVPIRPADIVTKLNPAWALLPPAQWISAQADPSQLPKGPYTYQLDFDLCSCCRQAKLSLSVLADNSVQVFLNDRSEILLEKAGPEGFKNPPAEKTFANPAGLVPGKNRLRAVVQNDDAGPTGLILKGRIEIDRCC